MKQVMCNVDLYGGTTKAGEWYDVIDDDGDMFEYIDGNGRLVGFHYDDRSRLPDGAKWSFRARANESKMKEIDKLKFGKSTLDKLVMLAADALRVEEYQIAIDIINLVKDHKK